MAARRSAGRPRKPGRPVQSAADPRERLLDAALARFVAEGIHSASLKSIAKAAGVTPVLVHYYFGSKYLFLADDISSSQPQAHTMALLERGLEIDHAH